jgi:hypothetical protein
MHILFYVVILLFNASRPVWFAVHVLKTTTIDRPKGRKLRE